MKINPKILNAGIALLISLPSFLSAKEPEHPDTSKKVAPADALALLKAGNQRFSSNKPEHRNQSAERRAELATGQHPFAIVLACADSRTSPELVFDQGLGDLFVVRVAGNVVNDEILGSIEYAVEHLGSQLIVVLGHERCGAVAAARDIIASKAEVTDHIQSLVKALQPAVEATTNADVETTAKTNEMNVAKTLRESVPDLKAKVDAGALMVVPAHYVLDTGVVEFLSDKK